MASLRPIDKSLALAALLHVAGAVALHRALPPTAEATPPARPITDVTDVVELSIDVLHDATPPQPGTSVEADANQGRDSAPARAAMARATAPRERSPGEAPGAAPGEVAPSSTGDVAVQQSEQGPSISPFASASPEPPRAPLRFTMTADELSRVAREDRPKVAASGAAAPSDHELSRRLEHRLKDAAVDHDRKVGVSSGGVVASALQAASTSDIAPQEGEATFEVLLTGKGEVSRFAVLWASDGHDGWARVAERARGTVAGSKLSMGSRSNGVRIKVHVKARHQLPSGSKERVKLKLPLQGTKPPPPDPQKQAISPHNHGPPPPVDHRNWHSEIPEIAALDLLPRLAFGVQVDPADLAAKQSRVVQVRVLDEEAL